MIRQGNLSYDYSGRKRKKSKPSASTLKKLKPVTNKTLGKPTNFRRDEGVVYKSAEETFSNCLLPDDDYKREVSKNYTIAPAYNKSGYQVISKEDIKHIGRS